MAVRLLYMALFITGLAGLLPLLPMAHAFSNANVKMAAGNYARYDITTGSGRLVVCSIPSQITLKKNQALADNFFSCTNNFGAPVTLTWDIVNDGGSGITVSGDSGAMSQGYSGCVAATLTAGSKVGTDTLIFSGTTAAANGLYASIQFSGTVRVVNNGATGGGCP